MEGGARVASRRRRMGMGALSLLGMTWAHKGGPAQWGHHHHHEKGITSQGPGGGPTVSHHAAALGPIGP